MWISQGLLLIKHCWSRREHHSHLVAPVTIFVVQEYGKVPAAKSYWVLDCVPDTKPYVSYVASHFTLKTNLCSTGTIITAHHFIDAETEV